MDYRFFYFPIFEKMDSEQNELQSIFEDEVSENSSYDSDFSSKLNSPFKKLDLEDNIIAETSSIDFSSDESFIKIKRKRVTLEVINEKLRKYSNMKNVLLQNDKDAQQVDNPNYPKPTVTQLKKTFTSTSKSSSSYNADIKITDSDRAYLNKAQINVTQKFLDKFANTELHVFENVHEDILLLNIPADDESFEEFLLTYDKTNGNKVDNGSKKFQTYTEYFLNKLKSLKHIQYYL
jgi:hypothetical protein